MKKKTDIDIIPDSLNANKHTEYDMRLLEVSMRKFGFVEAGVISEDGVICGGNARNEVAEDIGITEKEIIKIDGKRQVYLMPKGLKSGTPEFHELALALNSVPKANISWDHENIAKIQEQWNEIKVEDWGIPENEPEVKTPDPEKKEISTRLIVECGDVTKLSALYSELQDRGFNCELKE